MKSEKKKCQLCLERKDIQESHIIPKFIYTWLKATSATGHMRLLRAPNLRVQNGEKLKLLCRDCEQIFSRHEKQFAEKIFYPFHNNPSVVVRYYEYLLRFSASLTWRVLIDFINESRLSHYDNKQLHLADKGREVWRQFLLEQRANPGEFEQHVIPMSLIKDYRGEKLANGMNYYLMRAIDMDCMKSSNNLYVMAKLPGFVFLGFFMKPNRKEWKNTKINLKTGLFKPNQFSIPAGFVSYLSPRAEKVANAYNLLSEKQKKKVDMAFNFKSKKVLTSKTIEAMYQDCLISDGKAFVKSDD
jgi:hypothetical protein